MPLNPDDTAVALSLFLDARLGNAPRGADEVRASLAPFLACCQDWTDEQFRSAVIAYLSSPDPAHRFWPTPGQLRAVLPGQAEARAIAADEVWPQVLASLAGTMPRWVADEERMVAAYSFFRFNLATRAGREVLERACAAIGGSAGYLELCATPLDQLGVARAAFRRAWDAGGQRRALTDTAARVGQILGGPHLLRGRGEA